MLLLVISKSRRLRLLLSSVCMLSVCLSVRCMYVCLSVCMYASLSVCMLLCNSFVCYFKEPAPQALALGLGRLSRAVEDLDVLYIYIYIYYYLYTHICIHYDITYYIYIYIYICVHISIHIYIYIYMYIHVYMHNMGQAQSCSNQY